MRKNFVVRVALLLCLMGVVLGLSPISLVAATNPAITITNVYSGDATASGGKIWDACRDINNTLRDEELWGIDFLTVSYANNNCTITVNMTQYKKMDNSDKQKTMQIALDGVYNSSISRTAKNKIYNELSALDETTAALVRELSTDVRADFGKAYSWFKPFSGWVGWLLGSIALLMFMLLGITMVVDIAYISLPAVQLLLTDEANNRAKFVSYEAYSAVKEQQSKAGVEYKSPMVLYMKAKTVQFIAIFVCLLYLVSGQLYVLLANLMDYFHGILG